jgi:hypothetical protein
MLISRMLHKFHDIAQCTNDKFFIFCYNPVVFAIFLQKYAQLRGCFSVAFSCKCSAVNGITFFCDLACMSYFDFRGNTFKILYRTNFAIVCILRKWKHAFHFNPTLIDNHKSRIKY